MTSKSYEISDDMKEIYIPRDHDMKEPVAVTEAGWECDKVSEHIVKAGGWEEQLDKYSEERKDGATVLKEADDIIDNLDAEKIKAMPRSMRRKKVVQAKKDLKKLFKQLGTEKAEANGVS